MRGGGGGEGGVMATIHELVLLLGSAVCFLCVVSVDLRHSPSTSSLAMSVSRAATMWHVNIFTLELFRAVTPGRFVFAKLS